MNKQTTKSKLLLLTALLALSASAHAQGDNYNIVSGRHNNYISTGMPLQLIAPDAIAAGMGDAGVASAPDAYSSHWNNAKFAFVDNNAGISTTYTPWLRKLGPDMNFLYLGGYRRLSNRSTFGASLTYFSMGEIQHTGETGETLGEYKPNEFSIDVTYAMKLSDNLSLGATARYLRSDLTQGMDVDGQSTKPANGLAADVGLYYQQEIDRRQSIALGAHISNLGNKLSYSNDDTEKEFLPANLRVGGRYSYEIDDYNRFSVMVDFNKLLVPTPPLYNGDSVISDYYSSYSDYHQTSTMLGAIQSFYDAPGGLREELREISLSVGAEYWYSNTFAARIGYFYEDATKGDRKYLTLGAGIRYNVMMFDFAYLVPTSKFNTNPLANTFRVSLTFNFKPDRK